MLFTFYFVWIFRYNTYLLVYIYFIYKQTYIYIIYLYILLYINIYISSPIWFGVRERQTYASPLLGRGGG